MVMGGMSYREVARRTSCANSTIMRLVTRHNVTGSVNGRVPPGHQRVTSAREDRHIVLSKLSHKQLWSYMDTTSNASVDKR